MSKELSSPEEEGSKHELDHDLSDSDSILEPVIGWRTYFGVISSLACVFSGFYIGIQISVAYPSMVASVGGVELGAWIPNAYEVVTAPLAPVIAKIADTTGRRWILIVGLAISVLGCLIMSVATSFTTLLIGSILLSGLFANQGNFFALPAELLPRRYRGLGATLTVTAGGLGATMALLVNGSFMRDGPEGWRKGCYLGAANNIITIILLYFFYRPEPLARSKEPLLSILAKEFDWIGTFLLTAFLVPFMVALTYGGNQFPWKSIQVIAPFVSSGICLIGLVVHQVWWNKTGLFHHGLFVNRNFLISCFGLFTEGVVFLTFLVFYPLMTNTLYEPRIFYQCLRIVPFFLSFAIVSPLSGYYTRRYKDLRSPLILGWLIVLISVIVLSQCRLNSNYLSIAMIALAGIGFSTPLALLNAAAQLAVPAELLGLATGIVIGVRAVGIAIGTVILVSVFKAKLAIILPEQIANAALEAGLPYASLPLLIEGIASNNLTLVEQSGINSTILAVAGEAALEAYATSFSYGWYTALPFLILSLLLVISLDQVAIRKQMNWVVDRPVEKLQCLIRD